MACELDRAFDRARKLLPIDWMFTSFVQDDAGWVVTAAYPDRAAVAGGDLVWYPRIGARGKTLTNALNRLADRLANDED